MTRAPGLPDDVAQTLRDARRIHGITLAEIAAEAGVTVQFVGNVLRGHRAPTWRVAAALIDALPSLPPDVVEAVADAVGRRPGTSILEVLDSPHPERR